LYKHFLDLFWEEEMKIAEVGCRSVFWALLGAIYLTLGMPEVYRVLFEVFGMDVDAKTCQPKMRNVQDLDYLSPELDGKRLTWQEICFYQVCKLHSENYSNLLAFPSFGFVLKWFLSLQEFLVTQILGFGFFLLQPLPGTLFSEPRLFRACVPPGMHRFRGNLWEAESLQHVKHILGYPLPVADTDSETTKARNTELELGLQVCSLSRKKEKNVL
jgi:hypothetical protein